MTKWVCSVCGYVYEGEKAPEACPVCKAPADKFVKQDGEMSWAAEHVVGVAQGRFLSFVYGLQSVYVPAFPEWLPAAEQRSPALFFHFPEDLYPDLHSYYRSYCYLSSVVISLFRQCVRSYFRDVGGKSLMPPASCHLFIFHSSSICDHFCCP